MFPTDPTRPYLESDPEALDLLRNRFEEVGFNFENVNALIPEFVKGHASNPASAPVMARMLSSPGPVPLMTRVLLSDMPSEETECQEVFGAELLERLLRIGMLERTSAGIVCPFIVIHFHSKVIVFDHIKFKQGDGAKYLVMGLGTSTTSLMNATPRRRVRRALDLGCGGGIQSFNISPHADEVVGLDINPRALAFARAGARLNNCHNIDFRESDFFSAVDGEKFDLIVANPPFVISPESEFHYRDGGLGGDRVTEKVLRNVSSYLEEGGISLTICEWAHHTDMSAIDRLRSWVQGNGCDVWVAIAGSTEMDAYAITWLRPYQALTSQEQYTQLYEKWMAYYKDSGIQSVQLGLVVMRKRTGSNWFHPLDVPDTTKGPWGDVLLRYLDTQDILESSSQDQLLDLCYRLSENVRLRQTLAQEENRWDSVSVELTMTHPLPFTSKVDQLAAALCAQCDGTQTLRSLLTRMASTLEMPFEKLLRAAVPVIAGLIDRGFLYPAQLAKAPNA